MYRVVLNNIEMNMGQVVALKKKRKSYVLMLSRVGVFESR